MSIEFNEDLANVSDDFEVIPEGDYTVIVESCTRQAAKSGNGDYMKIVFVIYEGEFRGRKLFEIVNYWNSNQTAQDIAKQTLKKIFRASGAPEPFKSTSQFENVPMIAHVVRKVRADTGREENRIVRWERKSPHQLAQTTQQNGAKPWGRG